MKGIIYARFSSDNQREESIEGQLRECKAFAEKNDIQIIDSYIDRALSAKTDNRPSFQKMIKDSAKGEFDVIIVWKLDRFARNRYDSAHYKAILRKNGVKVVSATESISEGAEGILLESMLEGMAEYYSAELAEKVNRGLTENALKCRANGGTTPLGYYVDEERHYQIDPTVAPVVLSAFNRYADGYSMQEVVDYVNSTGVRSVRGNKININAITRMFHNRKYIGEFRYNDVVIPGGMPAIVSEELFERVQQRMSEVKRAPARHKAADDYLLTTKLFCGKCGCYMTGESGTSHVDDRKYRYYKCVNARKHTCDKKTVHKKWIEDVVLGYIQKVIFDDDMLNTLADRILLAQEKENGNLTVLRKQYTEVEKAINNLLNAMLQGIITPSTKQKMDDLEREKADLSVQISKEELSHPARTKEEILYYFHRFRKYDIGKLEHRKRLIDSFVNAIYLYDDKITLWLNYTDREKTITFAELEELGLGSDMTPVTSPIFSHSQTRTADFYLSRNCCKQRVSAPSSEYTSISEGYSRCTKIAPKGFTKKQTQGFCQQLPIIIH